MQVVATDRDPRRRGFSLIELMVVIAVLGTILTLTGTTFHLLMRSEKLVTQSFVTERTISRLAVQFRDDVHRSESGIVSPGTETSKGELTLGGSNGTNVRYVMTSDGLARLIVEGDAIVARDDFRLPECLVRFAAGDESDPRLRSLVIERPSATLTRNSRTVRPLRALEIQAYLHRPQSQNRRVSSTTTEVPETRNYDRTEESK